VARNIEIKARIGDRAALDRRVTALRVGTREELQQIDTFFRTPTGRLKLREFGGGTAELIRYDREDRPDARLSTYERVAVADAPGLRALLSRALGIRGQVKKHRTVLMVGTTRIHLDEVEHLGAFLEIEVVLNEAESIADGQRRMSQLMAQLDIQAADLIAGAYLDLLSSQSANSGNPFSSQNS
jgi:predicted adenylyl cyclase CyaB